MKMIRKLLSVVLALAMLLSIAGMALAQMRMERMRALHRAWAATSRFR